MSRLTIVLATLVAFWCAPAVAGAANVAVFGNNQIDEQLTARGDDVVRVDALIPEAHGRDAISWTCDDPDVDQLDSAHAMRCGTDQRRDPAYPSGIAS